MKQWLQRQPILCLITDPGHPNLEQGVAEALAAGVTMLQLRCHTCTSAQLYTLAKHFSQLCQQHQATFIVNDRLDVGLVVGAHGFQLGRHSLPIFAARQLVGDDYLLGSSIHSLQQGEAAIRAGADFLLAGTIFPSRSHPGEFTAGPHLIHTLKQAFPEHPLLSIGGITPANAVQAREAGADGVAVISAILHKANITQAVHDLQAALQHARKDAHMSQNIDDPLGERDGMITIFANGKSRIVKQGSSIADLLREIPISTQFVAVQLDGSIIPRDRLEKTVLHKGSKLEIVTLVGGG
jgi:thiamine-phosphate pyrophosphorylase